MKSPHGAHKRIMAAPHVVPVSCSGLPACRLSGAGSMGPGLQKVAKDALAELVKAWRFSGGLRME